MKAKIHKKKKQGRIHRLIRWHVGLTAGVISAYALIGFILGPKLLVADLLEKYHALADTVTVSATVPPPPLEPVVTGGATCPNDTLTIGLNWADDDGATSFDVYRDSALLVSGLTDSDYADTAVSISTSYSYEVIAYGPMGSGSATSDPVVVVTPDDCLALTAPTLSITSVGGIGVGSLGSISVEDDAPLVSGTSNMPNASVVISLSGPSSFSATVSTNSNGYWEWTPSAALSDGDYTLSVTVTNPFDSSQSAVDSVSFTVDTGSSSGGGHSKKKKKHHAITLVSTPTTSSIPTEVIPEITPPTVPVVPSTSKQTELQLPVLSLNIANPGNQVFQWRTLSVELRAVFVPEVFRGKEYEIHFSAIDESGTETLLQTETAVLTEHDALWFSISIPRGFLVGLYHLRADILFSDHETASAETRFQVLPLPLLNFGAGIHLTWDEALSFLGWVSFISILLLLLYLFLYLREYMLYTHARAMVTEKSLAKRGFFGARREVDR